jgi:hypothetical protein
MKSSAFPYEFENWYIHFDWSCVKSTYHFQENWLLNNIKPSDPWRRHIILVRLSLISLSNILGFQTIDLSYLLWDLLTSTFIFLFNSRWHCFSISIHNYSLLTEHNWFSWSVLYTVTSLSSFVNFIDFSLLFLFFLSLTFILNFIISFHFLTLG